MASTEPLPPSAASLSESLRDIGYSLSTALADIVDNSIAANAANIDIFFDPNLSISNIAVIDDGDGMDFETLLVAMKHGGRAKSAKRGPLDLGKFGLGLKTASFSQCRQLTVITRCKSGTFGAEWDLDLVANNDAWLINILDDDEIAAIPYIEKLPRKGTLVLWRKLDRLDVHEGQHQFEQHLNEEMDQAGDHLSLVFHKFLDGEAKGFNKVRLAVNNHPLTAFDPFCRSNTSTQKLPVERIKIENSYVEVSPFILPHHSKLTKKEYRLYKNRSEFVANQGVYIYRNYRLMAWGDWFRIIPKGEASKLARVSVDFPSAIDDYWSIDVKKSRATPPIVVKNRIRDFINRIFSRSLNVHKRRAKRLYQTNPDPLWVRTEVDGRIEYSINRENSLVKELFKNVSGEAQSLFQLVLDAVASTLPVELIYSDFSESPKLLDEISDQKILTKEELLSLHQSLVTAGTMTNENFKSFLENNPLLLVPNELWTLIEGKKNG